jgi:hypothetical protein
VVENFNALKSLSKGVIGNLPRCGGQIRKGIDNHCNTLLVVKAETRKGDEKQKQSINNIIIASCWSTMGVEHLITGMVL